MSLSRSSARVLAPLLVATGLVAVGPAATTAPPPAAAAPPGSQLSEQRAELTQADRVAGQPTSPLPGRQIRRASIEVELYPEDTRDWVETEVELAGDPSGSGEHDAMLVVGLGHFSGSTCQVSVVVQERTGPGTRVYDSLGTLGGDSFHKIGERPATPFGCVVVVVEGLDDRTVVHDALVGRLQNTYVAPRLVFGPVTLLDSRQKQLRLVRRVWTPYDVTVRNTGQRAVRSVRVTGKGKGLKVRQGRYNLELGPGEEARIPVQVRLNGKQRKTRLRLTADGGGKVTVSRNVQVRRVKAPRRPMNGRYRSKDGSVTFQIRKGRVTKFQVRTTTRCGTYLNPTQTTNTYDFPRTRIPANGILSARQRGKVSGNSTFTADLQMRAVGRKVTQASFRYYFYMSGVIGSNCEASERFTAKRVGR